MRQADVAELLVGVIALGRQFQQQLPTFVIGDLRLAAALRQEPQRRQHVRRQRRVFTQRAVHFAVPRAVVGLIAHEEVGGLLE